MILVTCHLYRYESTGVIGVFTAASSCDGAMTGDDLLNSQLPGAELVAKGLHDLARGIESTEALLVAIGRPRLTRLGLNIPRPYDHPEIRLYMRLAEENPVGAHSRYNALIRRLVSFERAAECAR